eukprot:2371489-Amphidinium_carterae.1
MVRGSRCANSSAAIVSKSAAILTVTQNAMRTIGMLMTMMILTSVQQQCHSFQAALTDNCSDAPVGPLPSNLAMGYLCSCIEGAIGNDSDNDSDCDDVVIMAHTIPCEGSATIYRDSDNTIGMFGKMSVK